MAADVPKDSATIRALQHPTTVPGGTRIVGGTYEVERLLKAGGMGEVYRGRNVFNGEPVAIKIVLSSQSADETHTKLFEREALVLSKLAHEAIVRYYVYTVDPVIGRPCLVMEFVPGPSLMERMAEGPMPLEDVRTVLRRVASGLEAAHKRGVIHRDLSPDNIILEDGLVEHAKLIDFGIAKAGALGAGTMLEGRIAGKYNYMAPEQLGLAGGVVDERADIYSLGLVVVGIFRGAALNMGENPFDAITRRQSVPDISAVPPEMQGIVARMLAPDPADRPKNMPALIKLLDHPGVLPLPLPPLSPAGGTVLGGAVPVQQPTPAPTPAPPLLEERPAPVFNPTQVVSAQTPYATPYPSPFAAPTPAPQALVQDSTVINPIRMRPPPAAPEPFSAPEPFAIPDPEPEEEATVINPVRRPPAQDYAQDYAQDSGRDSGRDSGQNPARDTARDATVITPMRPRDDPRDTLGVASTGGNAAGLAGIGQPGIGQPAKPAPPRVAPAKSPGKSAAKSPGKSPAKSTGKGKGVLLVLGGVAIVAVAAGAGLFALQGAQGFLGKGTATAPATQAVTPQASSNQPAATQADPTQSAQNAAETAAETAREAVAQAMAALSTAATGKCTYFHLATTAAGQVQGLSALTARPDGIAALTADFVAKFPVTPQIGTVAAPQCAALEFATIRGSASAKPADIVIDGAPDGTLKAGASLRGTVTGSAGRATALFLISRSGGVVRLDSYLKSKGQADAQFDIPVTLAPGSAASDPLLLSITTDRPIADFNTLADGYTAETVMPRLALWLQNSHQPGDIALHAFRLEP